ncbi:lyase family protein [Verrucomicrobiota bacterium]
MRTERDFLGEKQIPGEALWGIHTARALENFPLGNSSVNPRLLSAYAQVKKACALANAELGHLDSEKADAVIESCNDFSLSTFDPSLPALSGLQGGAGTSTNMMMNEIIANRALKKLGKEYGDYETVHPLDHINLHQSTNDTFPTALKVAAIYALRELSESVATLQGAFQRLEKKFADIPTIGRTERVCAVPLTLGAEFSGFAEAFARDRWRTFKCEERLRVVNLGGTAIGTGLTAPRSYIFLATEKLREITGLGLTRGENLIDQTANQDCFVEVSGILKALAVNLIKVCDDLRLLAMSGEIKLPAVQAGSSIMPGKVNPVILESVIQAGLKIKANDMLVADAASRASLQICEFMPLLADALLGSLDLLKEASDMLTAHADGIEADKDQCRRAFTRSPEIVTAFVPQLGYDRCAELLKEFEAGDNGTIYEFLTGKLGTEAVEKTLSPQNLMALGHR